MPDIDVAIFNITSNPKVKDYLNLSLSASCLAVIYPFEAYKKWAQRGYPKGDFRPYRGVTSFAANVVPTTILQRLFVNRFEKYIKDDNPMSTRLATAALCGAIPATTAVIVENCVTKQQELACENKPSKPINAFKEMFNERGYFGPFRSYAFIAVRDGTFVTFVEVFRPDGEKYLNKKLIQYFPENTNGVNAFSYCFSYLAAGYVGARLTHPFDTAGTHMQKSKKPMSYMNACKSVMSMPLGNNKYKWQNFYNGFWYRFGLFTIFLGIKEIRAKLVSPAVDSSFKYCNDNAKARLEAKGVKPPEPKLFTPGFTANLKKKIDIEVGSVLESKELPKKGQGF